MSTNQCTCPESTRLLTELTLTGRLHCPQHTGTTSAAETERQTYSETLALNSPALTRSLESALGIRRPSN